MAYKHELHKLTESKLGVVAIFVLLSTLSQILDVALLLPVSIYKNGPYRSGPKYKYGLLSQTDELTTVPSPAKDARFILFLNIDLMCFCSNLNVC